MYSYKLNNSYTVYCIPSWYDASKACDYDYCYTRRTTQKPITKENLIGAKVEHKIYGKGSIKSIDDKGKMIVICKRRKVTYQVECNYPAAFECSLKLMRA